jgi:CheY-like chemotaxis protein
VEIKLSETKTDYTILIAEDDIIKQILTKKILEKLGYRVIVVSNGHQAVSKYKFNISKIALILMDMQMPVLDGFEATKMIRGIEEQAGNDNRIPIIALVEHEKKIECIEAGCDAYLSKPIEITKLRKTLAEYLKSSA